MPINGDFYTFNEHNVDNAPAQPGVYGLPQVSRTDD